MNLQFISHSNDRIGYVEGIRMAIEGGCRWIQLRMKDTPMDTLREVALQVQAMCRKAEATFIIDDHVELVKEIHADGVHLGKNDMPIAQARQILGPDYIIGGTANTIDDIRSHFRDGADYIGCGPFRFTTTKKGLSTILGLEGYRAIVATMKDEGITLPIVAIGGIMVNDIPDIMKTGVTGIALSGEILGADNPIEKTNEILKTISEWKN